MGLTDKESVTGTNDFAGVMHAIGAKGLKVEENRGVLKQENIESGDVFKGGRDSVQSRN